MWKGKLGLAGLILILFLTGCGNSAQETASPAENETSEETGQGTEEDTESGSGVEMSSWRESVQKMFEDPYGDYVETGGEIAFLTDGSVEDGGYNEAIFNGVRMYALGAGTSFSCYHADPNAPESYQEIIHRAVEDKAGLIVCAEMFLARPWAPCRECIRRLPSCWWMPCHTAGKGRNFPLRRMCTVSFSMRNRPGTWRAIWQSGRDIGIWAS